MGFQMLTHPEFRGKGLTRLFKSMDKADFHFLGDQTPDSLKRYPSLIFGHKICNYYGMVRRQRPTVYKHSSASRIEKLEESHMDALYKFDYELIGMDRSDFIRKWAFPSTNGQEVHAFAAMKSSELVGYGIMRWFVDYWQINPLYANSAEIAAELIEALVAELGVGEGVFLRAPALCRTLHEFSHRNGMIFTGSEFRSYSDKFTEVQIERHLDWSKVYALQEFWPL